MKEWSTLRKLMLQRAASGVPINEYTATGNPLTFETNIAKPLSSLLIPWTPTQSGTGDPSPENVRPISGVSGLTVWRTGKNLFDEQYPDIGTTSSVKYRPIYVGEGTFIMSSDLSLNGQGGANIFFLSGNVQAGAGTSSNGVYANHPITKSSIDGYVTIGYRNYDNANPQTSHTILNIGETASEYSTYTGETVSVAFPALTKNLLSPSYLNFTDSVTVNGVTFKLNSDGSIKVSGTAPSSTTSISYYIQGKFSGNYWICDNGTIPSNADIIVYDVTHSRRCYEWDGTTAMKSITSSRQKEQIKLNDTDNIVIQLRVWNGSNPDFTFHPMLVAADETDYTYVPYNSTVYGGTLDLTTGVLTVEVAGISCTWADFTNKTSMGNYTRGFYALVNESVTGGANGICNIAKRDWDYTTDKLHFYTHNTNCYLFLPNDTDASTSVQIAYPLKTPITYQLTPQEITSLIGTNVLWSDTNGSNTATYLKKG